MSKDPELISLYDGRFGFWRRYAISYGTLFACIGVGVLIQSDAMQWVGAIIWLLGIIGSSITYNKGGYKTPQEAADYIHKTYGVKAP